MNVKRINIVFLFLICAAASLLVIPTINNNINDPNLIVYFNADEGYQMDLIWRYYTGQIRGSYQMDFDYGLEMLYLSDVARILFSKFIDFSPGTFVLILRWLHLISWVGALIALWYLVGYHFEKGWQQILAVLLLAVSPAFAYFSNNLKPEPLVLFFMIMGLNYTLRIIDNPMRRRNLFIAIACASIAFIVKFAGIFLLPAVVAAMYFSERYRERGFNASSDGAFPRIKHSWILESLIGICLIALPFLFIFSYVRKLSGVTFYEEFGILETLLKYKITFFVMFIGTIFILASLLFFFLNKSKNSQLTKVMGKINEINSYAFIVAGTFFGFLLLFGVRWIIAPKSFIDAYAYNLSDFTGVFAMEGPTITNQFGRYLENIIAKLISSDALILTLLGVYLIIELYFRRQNLLNFKLQFYKRLTLLIFLIPFFLSLFTFGRFKQHHMLPFFVAISILVIQGIYIFNSNSNIKRIFKISFLALIGALLAVDISANAALTVKSRVNEFHQYEDVAFSVAKWLRESISTDTLIVADHYTRVYIPGEYKNIKVFKGYLPDRIKEFRYLVNAYRPKIIYYNEGASGAEAMPPIDKILPDKKLKLLKSFDSKDRSYCRRDGDKFLIYEVLY